MKALIKLTAACRIAARGWPAYEHIMALCLKFNYKWERAKGFGLKKAGAAHVLGVEKQGATDASRVV